MQNGLINENLFYKISLNVVLKLDPSVLNGYDDSPSSAFCTRLFQYAAYMVFNCLIADLQILRDV